MKLPAGLNDEEEVTMQALGAFSRKGLDVPLDRASVGYAFLVERLVRSGFVAINGGLCSLTLSGRTELARLEAV